MSLGISINLHVSDEVTTIETHAPESQTATVKVRDEGGYNGVTLFFNDLAHVERWVRDLLGRVEVAKMGDEGDVCATWPQAEVAASDPVPVQPAGEVVESAVDASPAPSSVACGQQNDRWPYPTCTQASGHSGPHANANADLIGVLW